jgi:hypothetical protein
MAARMFDRDAREHEVTRPGARRGNLARPATALVRHQLVTAWARTVATLTDELLAGALLPRFGFTP